MTNIKKNKGAIMRILLILIFILGFGVFLAPVFTGILNLGNIFGMGVFSLLTALTIFWSKLKPLWEHKWIRVAVIAILIIAFILFILAVIISVLMVKYAHSPPPDENTVIVVLGCKVRGEVPSGMLSYRTYAAYNYLKDHPDVIVIVSGGQGADELISEAECMKRILVKKGISENRIIMEDKSTNTFENISFSKKIMDEYGFNCPITIATNEFHQFRAKTIAEKQGLEVYSLSAPTMAFLLPTYWIREIFGNAYEIVFP